MSNRVYVCYRRTIWSKIFALGVYQALRINRIDAFIDLPTNIKEQPDAVCLSQIAASVYVAVVLTPGSLGDCGDLNDSLRREIDHAIYTQRKIIFVVPPTITFADVKDCLESISGDLLKAQWITVPYQNFFESMKEVCSKIFVSIDPPFAPLPNEMAADIDERRRTVDKLLVISDTQLLAQGWLDKGAIREADDRIGKIQDYTQAIKILPTFAEAYVWRANVKQFSKDFVAALDDYNVAIRLDPYNPTSLSNRAAINVLTRNFQQAVLDATKSLELLPEQATIYGIRAVAHGGLGNYNAAMTDYAQAIHYNPQDADMYTNRGVLRGKRGDHKGALADLNTALEKDNANKKAIYVYRGDIKRESGDLAGAMADYDQALIQNPTSYEALLGRAIARSTLRDFQGAITDLTQVIALQPNRLEGYLFRGIARHSSGDRRGALRDYEKALDLLPNTGEMKETHDLIIRLGRAADSPWDTVLTKIGTRLHELFS